MPNSDRRSDHMIVQILRSLGPTVREFGWALRHPLRLVNEAPSDVWLITALVLVVPCSIVLILSALVP